MEDSGYFSHRSNEFKFSSTEGDSARIPSPEDLFRLKFDDLTSTPFSYLRHGFADEEDFEDFKRELLEFRRLRRGLRGVDVNETSSPKAGRNARDEIRHVESKLVDPVKVSVTEGHFSGETGEGDGGRTDRANPEGKGTEGEGAADGHEKDTNGADQPGSRSLLKRSVSLRVNGGGPRARVNEKRNGVYFDDSCFLSEPPCRVVAPRGSRAHAWCEAGNKATEVRGDEGSPTLTNSRNTYWPQSESAPPERNPALIGVRNEGGRENSGTPVSNELNLSKQNDFDHNPHETESSQNASNWGKKCISPHTYRDCRDSIEEWTANDEEKTANDRFFLNVETRWKCGVNEKNESSGSASRRSPRNCKKLMRQKYHSAERPAYSGFLPFICQNGRAEICGDDTSGPDGLLENCTTACGKLSPTNDPFVESETHKTVRVLPSKCPVTVSNKEENLSFQIKKIDGDMKENATSALRRNEEESDIGSAIVEGKINEHKWSQLSKPKRSSLLLLNLKRLSSCNRPASGRDLDAFMEFFSGDEHFQEFERVYEIINNRRFSRDMVTDGLGNRWREDGSDEDPLEEDHLGILYIDETFLDFFDNDEDFMEFERELEKITSHRRSRLLESLSRRSSCDIFSDVESFHERNQGRKRTPRSSPKVERRLSATNSSDCDLWNSAEEWNVVMKKLRRNSRLFSDQAGSSSEDSVVGSAGRQSLGRRTERHFNNCQCVRDCQYTCHSHCVPSVTLDCTTVSPGSASGLVATPSDLPSPCGSAETSLTERQTFVSYNRSPQIQPQCASEPTQAVSQSVQCLTPPGGAKRVSSPPRDVSSASSSERDPLLGTCVSQTIVPSKGSSWSSSACVAGDLNQTADHVDGGVLLEGRVREVVSDVANEKDETDSGYRSGTIPDEKLPKAPSQATLDRKELRRKIETFNHFVPKAALEVAEDGITFQGFLRVTLNLVRPITMELGARPPSIYELLTREHIVEQSTQHIAFYMPRDTVKSIHITSKTTTREVITSLLKKFHIVDNPRKFAMYEQEFNEKNKLVKLRRLTDKDFPLVALLSWKADNIKYYRLVLQENETGEIVWDAFSTPELKNFMIVLDREESEAITQLQYKYRVMKRIIVQRMKELRLDKVSQNESSA